MMVLDYNYTHPAEILNKFFNSILILCDQSVQSECKES